MLCLKFFFFVLAAFSLVKAGRLLVASFELVLSCAWLPAGAALACVLAI